MTLRPIPEFEGLYSIDESGRIWSHRNGGRYVHDNGTNHVVLSKDSVTFARHRDVMLKEVFGVESNADVLARIAEAWTPDDLRAHVDCLCPRNGTKAPCGHCPHRVRIVTEVREGRISL